LFHRGTAGYLKHNPGDRELFQFHSEAKELLARPCPNSSAETQSAGEDEDLTGTEWNKSQSTQTSSGPICLRALPQSLDKHNHSG
jgi:hypothetical protein